MSKNQINASVVKHISELANIPVSEKESQVLANAFSETLDVVDELKKIDVSEVKTTHQVTGLKNVFREDQVIESRQFTQEEALSNARNTHQGYFVVPQVLKNKDN